MVTVLQQQRHTDLLDRTIDTAALINLEQTKLLENRVAQLIMQTADPIGAIRETFRIFSDNWSSAVAASTTPLAQDTIRLHAELGWSDSEPTELDLTVLAQLQTQMSAGLATPYTEIVAVIATGLTADALLNIEPLRRAQRARIAISGYLALAEDPQIQRLQAQYTTLMRTGAPASARDLLPQLRKLWGTTPVGPNLLALNNTASHDSIMDLDSVYGQWRGTRLGITEWQYAGGSAATSREFCTRTVGRVFTKPDAEQYWQANSWGGKRSGNPFVVRGGYNCRHYWVPATTPPARQR